MILQEEVQNNPPLVFMYLNDSFIYLFEGSHVLVKSKRCQCLLPLFSLQVSPFTDRGQKKILHEINQAIKVKCQYNYCYFGRNAE